MKWFLLLAVVNAVVAEYGSQYSGYGTAEKLQRARASPTSSYGGDQQQGYSGDSMTPLVRVANPQTVTLRLGAASWSPHGIGRVGAAVKLHETPDEESSSSAEDETEDSSQPGYSVPLRPVQPPPATLDEQYPPDTNDIQSEIGQPKPQMNAIHGEALAYSSDLRLRVRRF